MRDMPPAAELRARLDRFRENLQRRRLPAALITDERNVRYLSGFSGADSALLVTKAHKFLLTDFRYAEEAGRDAAGWKVLIEKTRRLANGTEKELVPRGLMEKAGYLARKLRVRRLAVEAYNMRVSELRALRKASRGVRVKPEDPLLGELRLLKSDWEVGQIEKALRIQESCFLELCHGLAQGLSEREAAARLRYLMVQAGADDEAFQTLVLFARNSSLPHGRPGERVLRGDAIVLVDWGSRRAGYHSDLTRTFFLGSIPKRLREIHEVVVEAQRQAIGRIGPGVAFRDVDAAARDIIRKAGYGKAFGHTTGHGLGLAVHEAPTLSAQALGELRAGMVVTVEPGIYCPGVGGVRIEDDVLVTPRGHRVLSRLAKGLRWNSGERLRAEDGPRARQRWGAGAG